jgi:tripartite-type tricarboxylate transporter receptor subunit TctC
MKRRFSVAMLPVLILASAPCAADDFPSRDIRFVAPFSAGGPTDVAGRMIAEPLRRQLGQSIFIENMPGASGIIGTQQVVSGANDGYTILVGGIAPIALVPTVKTLRYDVNRDLTPLGLIWRSPEVLAVRPTLPVNSVKELIDYLKANPNKASYGSAGVGTVTHLAGELFKQEAGVEMAHVPYKSTSNSVTDLMGGQIDMIFGDIAILDPLVRSGHVKALAVTSKTRSPLLPDLQTMAEAGYPKVQTEVWFGLFVPTGAPPAVIERLKSAVRAAQEDPAYVRDLGRFGITLGDLGSEGLARFVREETERWAPILKRTGVTFQ